MDNKLPPELNELLDLIRQRGYPPVVTDWNEQGVGGFGGWEIEARLDEKRLLIMDVWPSGKVDAFLDTKDGTEPHSATTVGQILAWVKTLYSEGGNGL